MQRITAFFIVAMLAAPPPSSVACDLSCLFSDERPHPDELIVTASCHDGMPIAVSPAITPLPESRPAAAPGATWAFFAALPDGGDLHMDWAVFDVPAPHPAVFPTVLRL